MRAGAELDRSRMVPCVDGCRAPIVPLVDAFRRYVLEQPELCRDSAFSPAGARRPQLALYAFHDG